MRIIGPIPESVLAQVAIAERFRTLEDVVRWRYELIDVIVQDEYTHDVIVRGPAPAYLCFDTT
jgi:hypothetical protein